MEKNLNLVSGIGKKNFLKKSRLLFLISVLFEETLMFFAFVVLIYLCFSFLVFVSRLFNFDAQSFHGSFNFVIVSGSNNISSFSS